VRPQRDPSSSLAQLQVVHDQAGLIGAADVKPSLPARNHDLEQSTGNREMVASAVPEVAGAGGDRGDEKLVVPVVLPAAPVLA
jgi:hypothetical protein